MVDIQLLQQYLGLVGVDVGEEGTEIAPESQPVGGGEAAERRHQALKHVAHHL